MTENKRIALNVVATYGRSLYALGVGLFTGRWILMALGETDYGLYGVVGGLMAFVAFLNGLMAQAISRFYAFAVGAARVAETAEAGVEECRRWFSIALMIHVALPVALVAIGYPIGIWSIERFLTIPPDRIGSCIWVWRFTCLSGFVNMVNVPFSAMYNAKQEIAELTVYSFAVTTVMLGFTYYMVEHPGVWLTKYALWMCLLSVVPALIIGVRAVVKYPECRFRWAYVWDRGRIRQVLDFCGGRFVAAVASLASGEGMTLLVNKYLGPAKNAAMTVGNTIVSHASSLSNSLVGAFSPAITNAAGEGDYEKMRALMLRTCRLATAAVMVFAIPLTLEIGEVTRIWLKVPPAGTSVIAAFMLADLVVERVSDGLWIGIFAMGRIRAFQLVESTCFVLRLAIAWVMLAVGFDLESVGLAYVLSGMLQILVKLWFARSQCGLSPRTWFREVAGPLGLAGCAAVAAGFAPRFLAAASFGRVCLTTGFVECILLPLLWFLVLRQDERLLLAGRIKRLFCGRRAT